MKVLKNGEYSIPNDANSILGAGNFGKVYKAYTRTKEKIAIKEIPKSKLEEHPYIQEAFQSEIMTQKKATESGMPYFVKLIDHFSNEDYEYVVLEFCEGGTLTDYYKKNKLSQNEILEIIYQIGIGVEYLHRIGITHRDLKLDNILKMGNHYKIADFGFATEKSVLATCLGTGYYMSPELVKEEEYDRRVDVWAMNTILYKMLTKTYYFDGRSRNQLDNNIMSQKFKIPSRYSNWSELLKDLLEKGYIKDFRRRPTMLEYIEHPVFDPVKPKHTENVNYVSKIKFPANKNKISNSNSNSSNYNKISDTANPKEMIYQKLEVKLVNYINNLKNYFDLYVNLKNRDLVLALASLKRYLQHMTLVNIFFHNKKYIPTGMFRESGIDQNEWVSFFNMKQSKKFIIRIYHHLYVAIMEFKSSWTVLENDCRQKKKSNPIKVEISQPIKNSFVKGIEKMIEVLTNETDLKLFDAKNNMKTLLKLENNPPLFFRS